MATQFQFVHTGYRGKGSPSERSLIRSHCMKGKNKRADSRRSLRQASRAAKAAASLSRPTPAPTEKDPAVESTLSAVAQRCSPLRAVREAEAYTNLVMRLCTALTPPLHPAMDRFAEKSHVSSAELLHRVLRFARFTDNSYTIERCIDFDMYRSNNPGLMLFDDAFFHSLLLTTHALHDYALRRPLAKTTRFYLGQTLALLNERLSDKKAYLIDSNLYIILSLVMMAGIFGDFAATEAHISGLQRIVHLRGGLAYLRQQPKLHFKLESADLVWCLSFGGEPRFLTVPLTWDPFFMGHFPATKSEVNQPFDADVLDARLVAAFQDLQYLAGLVNDNEKRNSRLCALTFQPAMSSIQTRLLKLKDILEDRHSECLCLGALAFLTTTFQLPGRRLAYKYLADPLRNCIESMDIPRPVLGDACLWVLMVGAISVFHADEPWLQAAWKLTARPDLRWEEARNQLQKVVWIGCLQDDLGREAFKQLTV